MSHAIAFEHHQRVTALTETERIFLEELVQTQDLHEWLAAFREKRPPTWQHR